MNYFYYAVAAFLALGLIIETVRHYRRKRRAYIKGTADKIVSMLNNNYRNSLYAQMPHPETMFMRPIRKEEDDQDKV